MHQGRVKSHIKSIVCWADTALPYHFLLISVKYKKYTGEPKFKLKFKKKVYYNVYNCKNPLGLLKFFYIVLKQ